VHGVLTKVLFCLIFLHALVALEGDGTLRRMIRGKT
jgi:cytochrome b561